MLLPYREPSNPQSMKGMPPLPQSLTSRHTSNASKTSFMTRTLRGRRSNHASPPLSGSSLVSVALNPRPTQTSPCPPSSEPRPILITCFGETLPPDVGYKKSFADAPIFDGSNKEKYKPWKRALKNKLKN